MVCLDMTTSQIDAENTQMTNDLYRLIKKYSGLRNLIRQLKVSVRFYACSRKVIAVSSIVQCTYTGCLAYKEY